jgi:nicotinamide-nucleotide amidase
MFPTPQLDEARRLLAAYRAKALTIVTAESCTGGLIASLLTEIPGSSDVVERAFVAYSNAAKSECLGVPAELLAREGAVSAAATVAMAEGALRHSQATVAVAVTGLAGPGGGSATKPVGLVHLALARSGRPTQHRECRFGDVGRARVRAQAVNVALSLLWGALEAPPPAPDRRAASRRVARGDRDRRRQTER